MGRPRRILRALFVIPIRLYRWAVSPLLPDSCIYTPSCSSYALEAISRHGVVRGSIAALARLARCVGALYEGGEDPVPQRVTWSSITSPYKRFRRRRRRPSSE